MSGYLRRLAQRTLQATPEIRPAARHPFAPIPTRDTKQSILEGISEAQTTPQETMRKVQPNPVFTAIEAGDLPASPDKLIFEPDSQDSSNVSKTTAAPESRVAVQAIYEPARSERLPQEQVRPIPKQMEVSDSPSLERGVRDFDGDFEPLVYTAARVDEVVERQSIPVAAGKLACGRISPAESPRQFYPAVRNLLMRPFKSTASENNEVHVRIGRIEITAVHASQPTRPAPSPARKPMSLDEYLTKRNR